MNSIHQTQGPRVAAAVAAGIIALGMAACEERATVEKFAGKISGQMEQKTMKPVEYMPAVPGAAENTSDASNAIADVALTVKVKSALASDPELREFPLDVDALEGVVTLFGTVDTPQARTRALQVAQNVPGVQSVKSTIEIVKGS